MTREKTVSAVSPGSFQALRIWERCRIPADSNDSDTCFCCRCSSSLCSMDKDAIIAVLFMRQGCPDTDGTALEVRAFGVRGGKERK